MKEVKEKNAEEIMEFPLLTCQQGRLVEGGVVFLRGDSIIEGLIPYDRLVFLLAKEWIIPSRGYDDLPEPYFTDVMEVRD